MLNSVSFGDFETKSNEFLIPDFFNSSGFLGLESGKIYKFGLVVYIGKDINENDVFAKLMDSGQKIPDVKKTLSRIAIYLGELKKFKIGNVLSIAFDESSNKFQLVKEVNSPNRK